MGWGEGDDSSGGGIDRNWSPPNDENLAMGGGSSWDSNDPNGPVDVQPGGALDYGVGGDYWGSGQNVPGAGGQVNWSGGQSGNANNRADADRAAADKAFWDNEFKRLNIGGSGSGGSRVGSSGAMQTPASAADTGRQIKNETGQTRTGAGGGAAAIPAYQYIKAPTFNTISAPILPNYKSPDYVPPVEDPAYYRKQRAEASAPGMRALRSQAADQNMASRNLENPNARAVANRGAMQGYGQGVSSVQAGAAHTARSEADRKRSEDLSLFNTKYNILSKDSMVNYQNTLNSIMENYKQSLQKRDIEYKRDSDLWAQQPLNVKIDPSRYGAR